MDLSFSCSCHDNFRHGVDVEQNSSVSVLTRFSWEACIYSQPGLLCPIRSKVAGFVQRHVWKLFYRSIKIHCVVFVVDGGESEDRPSEAIPVSCKPMFNMCWCESDIL